MHVYKLSATLKILKFARVLAGAQNLRKSMANTLRPFSQIDKIEVVIFLLKIGQFFTQSSCVSCYYLRLPGYVYTKFTGVKQGNNFYAM